MSQQHEQPSPDPEYEFNALHDEVRDAVANGAEAALGSRGTAVVKAGSVTFEGEPAELVLSEMTPNPSAPNSYVEAGRRVHITLHFKGERIGYMRQFTFFPERDLDKHPLDSKELGSLSTMRDLLGYVDYDANLMHTWAEQHRSWMGQPRVEG